MNKALFSSQSIMWAIKWDFFDNLNRKYAFTTDVCAIKENAKCKNVNSPPGRWAKAELKLTMLD